MCRAAQYCCTRRGIYDGGESVTRCDGSRRTSLGFFRQGMFTYDECYTDLDTAQCIDQPEGAALVLVEGGILVAQPPGEPGEVARTFAVLLPGEVYDGAYQLNVGTSETPSYVYCTGRGVVTTEGDDCRVNPCGITVPHFVTIGPAAVDLDCYHTCYGTYES